MSTLPTEVIQTAITSVHARLLSESLQNLLKHPAEGSVAFLRCIPSPAIPVLCTLNNDFSPRHWTVWGVVDENKPEERLITGDRAVEFREDKSAPLLLLVDTEKAGAGMDGIYSASREVTEEELYKEASRLAKKRTVKEWRSFIESALDKANKKLRHGSKISPWRQFDFLARCATISDDLLDPLQAHPGTHVHLLGLWPIYAPDSDRQGESAKRLLDLSAMLADRLLSRAAAAIPPKERIDSLRLRESTPGQQLELERFLRDASTVATSDALAELANRQQLHAGRLLLEANADVLTSIELIPWYQTRGNKETLTAWSGLKAAAALEDPPELILDLAVEQTNRYSHLEIRWNTIPPKLPKASATYEVTIRTELDQEPLASVTVLHAEKQPQKIRFSNDDFPSFEDNTRIVAYAEVTVLGDSEITAQRSVDFVISVGEIADKEKVASGTKVRSMVEGLLYCEDLEVAAACAEIAPYQQDYQNNYVAVRFPESRLAYRVFRPNLLHDIELDWVARAGVPGRWRIKVRSDGVRSGAIEFLPIAADQSLPGADRLVKACRNMATLLGAGGGSVAVPYHRSANYAKIIDEYILAWTGYYQKNQHADTDIWLAGTVEVQSLSGQCMGVIVLPLHPLRCAWHAAYDALGLHTRFEQDVSAKEVRKTISALDGSLFPAFLPGLMPGQSFTFGDCLGFHGVAMVLGSDPEPKATISILASAFGADTGGTAQEKEATPTVGDHTAVVLANEINRYLDCHTCSRFLHLHGLRPGDGMTLTRALGKVLSRKSSVLNDAELNSQKTDDNPSELAFVLELHPGPNANNSTGRFLAKIIERRRSGSGTTTEDDAWVTKSITLPGGVQVPRLRWAKREYEIPRTVAHIATAFDTFDSYVAAAPILSEKRRPSHIFGLSAQLERSYCSVPSPNWTARVSTDFFGETHPAGDIFSKRLSELHSLMLKGTVINLGADPANTVPVLKTEISPDKEEALKALHQLSDWVITVDRNAGIEYFDSPEGRREVYDSYVIDCVPEREDLGCLQLVTSTSNLDEVCNLLNLALDEMGLSHSRRNAEFLLGHLKALSGRLAIRLTGQGQASGELVALALAHQACLEARSGATDWPSLRDGFFVPLDDVRDLLPPSISGCSDVQADDVSDSSLLNANLRADILHVSASGRSGLAFRFIEIKYRRHLRSARDGQLLQHVADQTSSLRYRWNAWYFADDIAATDRSIRRSKLVRMLRFYAEKARRHHLDDRIADRLLAELDKMISEGAAWSPSENSAAMDRGLIFCPEIQARQPVPVPSPAGNEMKIYLFGPDHLPDNQFQSDPPTPRQNQITFQNQSLRPIHKSVTLTDQTVLGDDAPLPSIDIASTTATGLQNDKNVVGENTIPDGQKTHETSPENNASPPIDAQSDSTDLSNSLLQPDTLKIVFGRETHTNTDAQWEPSVKGNPHLMIVGLPGMGKTHCLSRICQQFLSQGVVPIVFSFHEDIDEKLNDELGGVRFLDFDGLGFNPLHVDDRSSSIAHMDVTGSVRDIISAIFPDLGEIQTGRVREALKTSYAELGWNDAGRDRTELQTPEFRRFYEILSTEPKPDRGLMTRLNELDDYGIFNTGTADESSSLWDEQRTCILRIHKTQNDMAQRAFSFLVFYSLYKSMFRRGPQGRLTHAIVFDEAHRASRLKLLPTMAKECRKYGVSLVLASQEAKDFDQSLYSAIANYLILRLTETDAKALVRNVASSDQERQLTDRIKQMERYRALWVTEAKRRPSFINLSA